MKKIVFLLSIFLALTFSVIHSSQAAPPQNCPPQLPGESPRNCVAYGDDRDNWLFGSTFLSAGSLGAAQAGNGQITPDDAYGPEYVTNACNNHADDDFDSRIDYDVHPGVGDPGCTSYSDDDETDVVPPPPPPPPPDPMGDPDQYQDGQFQTSLPPPPYGSVGKAAPGDGRITCWTQPRMQWDRNYGWPNSHVKAIGKLHACEPGPAETISVTTCIERAAAFGGAHGPFYPIDCNSGFTISNFRLVVSVSHKCQPTQSRWVWRSEMIWRFTDYHQGFNFGHMLSKEDWQTDQWPNALGTYCK